MRLRHYLMLLLLLLAPQLFSQPAQDNQGTPRFRAEVDQIVVYASVYDDGGQLKSGLTKDDFQVFEDRVEQTVTTFAQAEIPSTIGLVLDSSGSMRDKMRLVEQAMNRFLDLNNPQNELFFVRFDDEVELEEDYTREAIDVRDAIGNVIVKGGTALYDAVYLSVDKAQSGSEPKKVVVVFTDGEDKDSYYTSEELVDKVQESDTQIFFVAFLDEELSESKGFFGLFKSQRQKVKDVITSMAGVTGGRAFFPKKIDELDGIFEAIARDLKNQYRLAYVSSNRVHNGEWRRIDVTVTDAKDRGLRIRARKGYYAPEDS